MPLYFSCKPSNSRPLQQHLLITVLGRGVETLPLSGKTEKQLWYICLEYSGPNISQMTEN